MKKAIFGTLTRTWNTTRQNKLFVLVLLLAVCVSVLVRPQIFSPELTNAEWNSATVMRHIDIWEQGSAWRHAFNPAVTYEGNANLNIDNNASHQEGLSIFMGRDGGYYYVSYPQFGYIAPYVFMKITLAEPSIVSLRIFSVLVQVLTAAALASIVWNITRQKGVAGVAFVTYMLLPITLYYHADNYMSDMFVPLFFVLAAQLFLKITQGVSGTRTYIAFGALMFLMSYTEYIGVFASIAILGYAIFNLKRKFARPLVVIALLAPALAGVTTILQYSLVGDLGLLVSVMVDRYSNSYSSFTTIGALHEIFEQYVRWYLVLVVAALGLVAARMLLAMPSAQGEVITTAEKKSLGTLTFFLVAPVILHHAILFHWTAYHAQYFSLLKTAPALVLALSIAFWILVHRSGKIRQSARKYLAHLFLLACAAWSVIVYVQDVRLSDTEPFSFCRSGKLMANLAEDDQIIFVKDARREQHEFPLAATFSTCAKRNLAIYQDEDQARMLMRRNGVSSGVIFTIAYFADAGSEVLDMETIALEE